MKATYSQKENVLNSLIIQLTMEDVQKVFAICMDGDAGEALDFMQETLGKEIDRCFASS